MASNASKASGALAWCCRKSRGIRPRTALCLCNEIVRQLLECGSEVWSLCLTRAQKNRLQRMHTNFLRKILEAPTRVPTVALHLETGTIPLQSRWDQLCSSFFAKVSCFDERRISAHVLRCTVSSNTRWAAGLRTLISSLRKPDAAPMPPIQADSMQLWNYFRVNRRSIAARDEAIARDQVLQLPSLSRFFHLRSWEPISREHAWATTHVRLLSHLHCEAFLDQWHDRPGVRWLGLALCCGGKEWQD